MLEGQYVICDKQRKMYAGESDSVPAIIWSFTDRLEVAKAFTTKSAAEECLAWLAKNLYKFDGNTRVPNDYLCIRQIQLVDVMYSKPS